METTDRKSNGVVQCNEVVKQVENISVNLGDIETFLNGNTDLGPLSHPKLLAILEKLKCLKLELAAVIAWGKYSYI